MRYKEKKYRTILDASSDELQMLLEKSKNDFWRPNYHIYPEYGLLNDPNGLAYFNGKYHLFHQWYPFGTTHGMKHWAHLTSKNLVEWVREEVALIPLEDYESHGAYSGTAITVEDNLYLYYTGNIKYDKVNRHATQCLAIMDKDNFISKHKNNALISSIPDGYTGHVRDPKVFKRGNYYYMILGAQKINQTGAFIIYKSKDAIEWDFIGELSFINFSNNNLGYMWECPDYAHVDGKDVLIFSPQGVNPQNEKYKNIFNVVYVVGDLNLEELTFKVEYFDELERGFDFYATQMFEGKEKQTLLFAWAGVGEFEYPTDNYGWAHCLTFPREISLKDNRIIQSPAKELILLRNKEEHGEGVCYPMVHIENHENVYELNLRLTPKESNIFSVRLAVSDDEYMELIFNKQSQLVTLDRSQLKHQFVEEFGTYRTGNLIIEEILNIKILMDCSIVEIFINDGLLVFTSRLFPEKRSTRIQLVSDSELGYTYSKYTLNRGLEDTHAINS